MKRIAISGLIVVLALAAVSLIAADDRKASVLFQAAMAKETVQGDLKEAIELYEKAVNEVGSNRTLAAKALVRMAECYQKLGSAEFHKIYERVIREFADQAESAAAARARLAAMPSAAVAQVGQTARLLWSDLGKSQGSPNMASPSTDGRYVSFSEGEGDQALGLGILDLKAGQILHVSRTSLSENAASWGDVDGSVVSPDGRQVAYIWEMEAGHELRVLEVNGGKAAKSRSLHLNPANSGYNMSVGGWSPDGKSVVVVIDRGATEQIAAISIADGAVRVLRDNIPWGGKTSPRFSPDGRYIVYERRDGQNPSPNDIFVLTLDGRETRVVEDPGVDTQPMWSPDGSHVVFLSNRTGNYSLWMIPVAGGTPNGPAKLVKANVGSFYANAGSFLPLGMTRSGALYYVAGNTITNVHTVDLDARLNTATAPSIATNRYLNSNLNGVWSPDGQYLAYLSTAPGGVFIRIQTVRTGEDREVPARIPISGPVRWFPDGQSLLVASRDARILNGQVGYYRVNIASGNAELLHQSASRDIVSIRPDLSPDGKTIFYLETPGQPVRFDIDSRRETRLTPLTPVVAPTGNSPRRPLSLAVSPDAAQIAYLSPEGVVVVPAAGGEPRELVRLSGASDPYERVDGLGGLAWSPDQRYLFFVKPDIRAIWRVPLAGGEAENIVTSKNRIRALRMHPAGRRLAFDLVDAPSELWVLENFLPKTSAAR